MILLSKLIELCSSPLLIDFFLSGVQKVARVRAGEVMATRSKKYAGSGAISVPKRESSSSGR